MNLYFFTYFVILICIRTIYSQVCVNLRIIGKNGDDWVKDIQSSKKKRWNTPCTH